MVESKKSIAILCNYRLLPERVGGMDHFFWRFDAECKAQNIAIDWFFPNVADQLDYGKMTIISAEGKTIETAFLTHFKGQKPRYSHIITHFLELCTPFFKKLKQQTQAKIIAVDHNPRPLGGYSFKKQVKKRLKGAVFSRYIDVFVGVSRYTAQELKKDFGRQIASKTIVIYNGIELENIKQKVTYSKPPRFLVVSHLRRSKGIQDLIDAVNLLPEVLKKDMKIDVYGEGPFEMELRKLAAIKRVDHNFVFKGSSSAISSIFCNYDYLLHPTHMECFSLTLLESLAANVPVVTTPVGGNTEIVEDRVNGFLVPVENPEILAILIEKLWNGEKTIQASTRSKIAAEFSMEQMVENHIDLIPRNE